MGVLRGDARIWEGNMRGGGIKVGEKTKMKEACVVKAESVSAVEGREGTQSRGGGL